MKSSALILAGLLTLSTVSAAGIRLYPSGGGHNLRVPVVPPVAGGANGSKHVSFEQVNFSYEFAPHLSLEEGAEIEFYLRDIPRRFEKKAFVLSGNDGEKLEVVISAASAGRGLELRCGKGKVADAAVLSCDKWRKFQLKLDSGKAVLTGDGKELALTLPAKFNPVRMSVYTAVIDELVIQAGKAELALDWEQDYAARLTPAGSGGMSTSLHGFDNFAVSTDFARRDCPVIQIINSSPEERTVTLDCTLKAEMAKQEKSKQLTFTVPARSEIIRPLEFPFPLGNDVYHLTGTFTKHFFHAVPRGEAPGPGLFGLHDADVNIFGFWPDALPLRFAHKYLRWGYVIGPAWVKDWNGQNGLDPATPVEEWNWNEKIDWELDSGRELYVCLYGTPLLDWQRARPYERMKKHPWGWGGGFPELNAYGKFIRAAADRYQGRIRRWEIENEPNASGHMPNMHGDYAEIAKTVYRELKAADRDNIVYGISGTSTFVPWMKKVLELGAPMDAVSWHTYTTPRQPDEAGLPAMLEEAKKTARSHKIDRFINSETGVLIVQRYKVDEAIPPETVAEKVAERATGFVSRNAWPGKVNDEYQASASMVKNSALNLLAGAEGFVFFGWNSNWPRNPETWQESSPWFGLFACTAKGERTPSLATLAIGVMTRQFEGVQTLPAPRPSGESSVRGGFFRKANGGEVALLWSAAPTGSVLLTAPDDTLELVTLHGEKTILKPLGDGKRYLLNLTGNPVYIHASKPGMTLLPSPVDNISVDEEKIRFTLLNRGAEKWTARIRPPETEYVKISPAEAKSEIMPKKRRNLDFAFQIAEDAPKELHLSFAVELPGGGEYLCPVKLGNKPFITIPRFAGDWNNVPAIALDKAEQAIIGRPSGLASLQEDDFWGGPDELSGKVRLAFDDNALYIKFDARDVNMRTPSPWPGVVGSCVELFLDFREPGTGLGNVPYEKGVCQILAHPPVGAAPARIYCPQLPGVEKLMEFSGKGGKDAYTLVFRLPWKEFTKDGRKPERFGFDLGINGVYPGKAVRKAQLMLYGTPLNFRDASEFGVVRINKE